MDAQEFNSLFLTLADRHFRLAKSLLQNNDEAQDAVQDLRLKLWEKRHTLDNTENKPSFTLKALRNLCIDMLRKRHFTEEMAPDMENKSPNPMEQTELKDMNAYISKLMDLLPETQRSVIRMRDVEEMEIAEIAYVMNLTENAVTVNLSRARSKIREQLLHEF